MIYRITDVAKILDTYEGKVRQVARKCNKGVLKENVLFFTTKDIKDIERIIRKKRASDIEKIKKIIIINQPITQKGLMNLIHIRRARLSRIIADFTEDDNQLWEDDKSRLHYGFDNPSD